MREKGVYRNKRGGFTEYEAMGTASARKNLSESKESLNLGRLRSACKLGREKVSEYWSTVSMAGPDGPVDHFFTGNVANRKSEGDVSEQAGRILSSIIDEAQSVCSNQSNFRKNGKLKDAARRRMKELDSRIGRVHHATVAFGDFKSLGPAVVN